MEMQGKMNTSYVLCYFLPGVRFCRLSRTLSRKARHNMSETIMQLTKNKQCKQVVLKNEEEKKAFQILMIKIRTG